MAYRRSLSQLNGFTRCGEAFRLQRMVKGLPERPAAWTAVGNAFHIAYESWELSDRTTSMAEGFAAEYDQEISRLRERQPDLKWWVKAPNVGGKNESYQASVERDICLRKANGLHQAESYEQHCRSSPWVLWRDEDDNPAMEIAFAINLNEVPVVGRIDQLLLWQDGQVTVRDIKTGAKGDVESNRQLGLYRLAAKELFGIDLIYGEYYYTKLGMTGGFVDLRRYTAEYFTEQFGVLNSAIDQKLFLPNPGKHCVVCSVQPWCREMGTGFPEE